ncbi:MAG TPA: cysteine peptidase family C39 domain-containing protein [Blastocatellia bacterium]|nr:cysteine peptidase family C39 domain-containing protein [Blastocatellia bacterium]
MAGRLTLHRQETEYSCAPACLKMVLESLGTIKTEEELRNLTDCTLSGTHALSLVEAARKLGFSGTRKYSLTFEELKEVLHEGLYPIVYLRAELSEGQMPQMHAVVVEFIDHDGVHLLDPWRGTLIYDFDRFTREWSVFHGLTILVEN